MPGLAVMRKRSMIKMMMKMLGSMIDSKLVMAYQKTVIHYI